MLRVVSCLLALLTVSYSEKLECTPGISNLDIGQMSEGPWYLPKYFSIKEDTLVEGDIPSFRIDFLQQRIDVPPEVAGDVTVTAVKLEVEGVTPYLTSPILVLAAISENDGIINPIAMMTETELENEREFRIEPAEGVQFHVIATEYDSWLLLSFCQTRFSDERTEPGAFVLSRSPGIDADTLRTIREHYSTLLNIPPEGHPGENTVETRDEGRPFFLNTFFKAFTNGRK